MWKRRSSRLCRLECLILAFLWTGWPAGTVSYAHFLPVTATFRMESPHVVPPGKKNKEKRARYQRGNWFRVSGYADSRFFYGQLQLLGKGKVAGYLYPPKKDPLYVYGEITRSGIIRAFDNQGVLYRLVIENSAQ